MYGRATWRRVPGGIMTDFLPIPFAAQTRSENLLRWSRCWLAVHTQLIHQAHTLTPTTDHRETERKERQREREREDGVPDPSRAEKVQLFPERGRKVGGIQANCGLCLCVHPLSVLAEACVLTSSRGGSFFGFTTPPSLSLSLSLTHTHTLSLSHTHMYMSTRTQTHTYTYMYVHT